MKIWRKMIGMFLSVALVASFMCAGNTVQAEKSGESFDEDNIILQFGLMSDLHFDAVNTYTENYKNNTAILQTAVGFLKDKIGEDNLRAIVIGGDVDNWNGLADLRMARSAFDGCLDSSKTELLPTVGNHDDWCTDGMAPTDDPLVKLKVFNQYNLYQETLGDYVYWDKSRTQEAFMKFGYYHTAINGIHFLSVVGVDSDHSNEALTWMTQELTKIHNSEDGGKPVFIITHCPPRNTAVGTVSDVKARWTSDTIAEKLKDYPEAILLTGHTHASANSPNVLWQEDGFSVLHSGCLGEGEHSFATMEIDKDYHIRYNGYHVVPDSGNWAVDDFTKRKFVFTTKATDDAEAAAAQAIIDHKAAVKRNCIIIGSAVAVLVVVGTIVIVVKKKKKSKTTVEQ